MRPAPKNLATRCCVAAALACGMAGVQAADGAQALKLGFAHIGFNTKSGELTGPAGLTPPGVRAELDDARTLALIYERQISGPWSLVLQVGTPPVVRLLGAGTGAPLGEVGAARAWFPALVVQHAFAGPGGTQPYVGLGVNRTSYTEARVNTAYTAAFGGSASSAKLKTSWGTVLKVGVNIPVGDRWMIDAAYSRYGIRTTATITTTTPPLGDVARSVDVRADPDVVGVTFGYRF